MKGGLIFSTDHRDRHVERSEASSALALSLRLGRIPRTLRMASRAQKAMAKSRSLCFARDDIRSDLIMG
jgi:hypothetical protein